MGRKSQAPSNNFLFRRFPQVAKLAVKCKPCESTVDTGYKVAGKLVHIKIAALKYMQIYLIIDQNVLLLKGICSSEDVRQIKFTCLPI